MPGRLIGLDKSTGERLFKGQMTIEGRLDLHGLTQAQAHDRLQDFLSRQARAGARCLLIVTGKGAAGGGVLKENVPRWLNEPALRRYLVAFGWAQPRHGGQGALYVLLKRNREETR